jgi:hypothetical protein
MRPARSTNRASFSGEFCAGGSSLSEFALFCRVGGCFRGTISKGLNRCRRLLARAGDENCYRVTAVGYDAYRTVSCFRWKAISMAAVSRLRPRQPQGLSNAQSPFRVNAEACRGAFVGARGSRLLGQSPHLARSGHRGSDALPWSTLVRSARAELRRSAAARIPNPRAGQRKQGALVAVGSRNHKTAGSLPAPGAAAKLWRASVCRS